MILYNILRWLILTGETLHETYKKLWLFTNVPNFLRPMIGALLPYFNESRKANLIQNLRSGGLNVRDYWELIGDKKEISDAYEACMKEFAFDAILMPATALPAPPHGMIGDLLPSISYCTIINLLHWPSGVVPVSQVYFIIAIFL